ncbi:MAG TPA: methyltransferase domain-containing protein [Methyloceanibacter sp.]|nr:methyltransferase domain-containing protein [Methyloceanibacter sp.]
MTWARKRAVDVHDETAGYFLAEYASDNICDSPFRYGRSLIDAEWLRVVNGLPPKARCLDVGSGIGSYMARLLERGMEVQGIEPSAEMRKLALQRVPEGLVSDGSVTDLPMPDRTLDFVYAIEVFRYLDTADNMRGHREILRALKPGGRFFGTYVNKWALDLYRQFMALQKARDAVFKLEPRYHAEFETVSSLRRKLTGVGFEEIEVKGAMFAPLRPLHKLSPKLATALSGWTLPREKWLSDALLTRPLAGHLIVTARRGG